MNIYAVHFFGTVPFLHKKPCFIMQKDFKKSVGNSPEMVHINIHFATAPCSITPLRTAMAKSHTSF